MDKRKSSQRIECKSYIETLLRESSNEPQLQREVVLKVKENFGQLLVYRALSDLKKEGKVTESKQNSLNYIQLKSPSIDNTKPASSDTVYVPKARGIHGGVIHTPNGMLLTEQIFYY